MNHVFRVTGTGRIRVPDNTFVYPFLNPKDSTSTIPWDLTSNVSVAIGEINPRSRSKIHIHPLVTLITWVVSGTLKIKMKDPNSQKPYLVILNSQEAALTEPQTFLQHINTTDNMCRVLYIVSPAYVYLVNEKGQVIYDDAIVTELSWKALAQQHWNLPGIADLSQIQTARARALELLHAQKDL